MVYQEVSDEELLILRNDILPYKEYNEYGYNMINDGGIKVTYCNICGLPKDYCEYGNNWDKCCKTAIEEYPLLYPQYNNETLNNIMVTDHSAPPAPAPVDQGGISSSSSSSAAVITIRKVIRNKRKTITSVDGLDNYGINLQDCCKVFAKKFACGCGIVNNNIIEIQGDIEEDLFDYILDNWGNTIPDDVIIFGNETTKKGRSRKHGGGGGGHRKGNAMKRSGAATLVD